MTEVGMVANGPDTLGKVFLGNGRNVLVKRIVIISQQC